MWLNNEPNPRGVFGSVIKNWANRFLTFVILKEKILKTKSYNNRLPDQGFYTDYGKIGDLGYT